MRAARRIETSRENRESERFLSIPAFVFDDFCGAGFLVSCSVDCYSLEVVERLVEVSVKLLVYEDFWRNLIERSLIFVRFWIFSSRESLPCLPNQERSGCLGRELQRLVRTLLRYLRLEVQRYHRSGDIGFECLPPSCDGLTGSEDHGPMISQDLQVSKLDRVECQLVDPRSLESQLFVLRLDLVFLFLILCCLGLCYPFAGSSGIQAGPSGVPAGRSPFLESQFIL
ncbi:hypothetical protein F511_14972 [Dorcoceras hygrometricum]|uniref:Uncharacterized protein n=1 Tax=Dorcoceras hygrometricum TaxID=472368 RepID=A0A2Z7B9S6_9LAMI|nr:hypothetical protein F511_14972 [Dorcoceras hygrometricum]